MPTGEVLKGHLEMLLLATVREGPAHGYAVVEELRTLSGGAFDLPEGTIYPALHRLERARLLASGWTTVAGRRRRVYRLTATGSQRLTDQRADWALFVAAVGGVLREAKQSA